MWLSCHKKIEKQISSMPEGSVFVISDFEDIAVDDTVSKSLTRLTEGSFIKRLFRGVYWRPKKNREKDVTSEVEQHPDPDQIALALARNNKQRVIPCGETALHLMGLANEPSEWTYITDGAYHKYSYKNICISFKHATGKLFSSMSDKTALVVQVLRAYGKDKITMDTLISIKNKLSKEELSKLLREAKHTTVWIYGAVKQICALSAKQTTTTDPANG